MSGRMIPMAGKTFGALRAVEPCRNMRAGWTWLCWCLTCGAIQDRLGSHLRSGYRADCSVCGTDSDPGKAKHARVPHRTELDRVSGLIRRGVVVGVRGGHAKRRPSRARDKRAAYMRSLREGKAEAERHAE